MSVQLLTTVTVYCDGQAHGGPLQFTIHGAVTAAKIAQRIRDAGWLLKRDGRTFCDKHRAGA